MWRVLTGCDVNRYGRRDGFSIVRTPRWPRIAIRPGRSRRPSATLAPERAAGKHAARSVSPAPGLRAAPVQRGDAYEGAAAAEGVTFGIPLARHQRQLFLVVILLRREECGASRARRTLGGRRWNGCMSGNRAESWSGLF